MENFTERISYFAYPGAVKTVGMMKEYTLNSIKKGVSLLPIEDVVLNLVCTTFNVSKFMIKSGNRKRIYLYPRHFFCYLTYMFGYLNEQQGPGKQFVSFQMVGDFIDKDHATVIHGIRSIISLCETNKEYDQLRLSMINILKKEGYKWNEVRAKKYGVDPIYKDE